MKLKKIIGSLKKRGIKGSFLRLKNGNPKINTIDFWSFITNQKSIPFSKEDYEKHRNEEITLNWVILHSSLHDALPINRKSVV